MKYFTTDVLKPNENTLNLIKQIARTCRVTKGAGNSGMFLCLN
jgi:hypothetical protein